MSSNKFSFSGGGRPWNFANYGNLYFFNKFNNNFFYFNFLLNSYERHAPNLKYLKIKHEIGNKARNYLLDDSKLTLKKGKDNLDFNQSLDAVMQILNDAILYERNNEMKYISEQKSKFEEAYKGIETEESKKIKEAFGDFEFLINKAKIDESDSIDYIKLINLINYILQGKKNTNALIDFEKDHLDEIDNRMKEIHDAYENQMRGFGKAKLGLYGEELGKFINNTSRRHKQKIRQTYAIRPSFREKESKGGGLMRGFGRLKGLQTSDVKIGKWITETIDKFLNDKNYLITIKQKIEENPPNDNPNREKAYENAASAIRELIIKSVTDYAKDHMSEILTNSIDNKTLDTIADELTKNYSGVLEYDITGWWNNFGIYGRQDLSFFKELAEGEKERIASAEGFTDTINKFIKRITKENKEKQKLTTDEKALGKFFQITDENGNIKTDSYIYELLRIIGELEAERKAMNKRKKNPDFYLNDNNSNKQIIVQLETTKEGELILNKECEAELRKIKIGNEKTLDEFLPKEYKNFKSLVSNLKRNVSIQLRNLFREAVKGDSNINDKKLEQLKNALLPVEVRVGGPTYSEIVEGLQQQSQNGVKSIWTGKLSVKNDFISIQIDAPVESFTINFNKELENITENQIDNINSIFSTGYKEISETMTSTIYKQMQDINKDKSFTDYEKMTKQFFELQKKREEAQEQVNNELKQAIEKIKENKELTKEEEKLIKELSEKRNNFLKQFKDSLYISSTMKTYNAYQNDVGFTGGSLGPNLTMQLQSIRILYRKAGFDFPDETFEWIRSAVINCSPHSVIGEKYKNKLETFLGSLAIFSLFNEGGAELAIIKKGVDHALKSSNMKIMHLYRLNGLYYPGSFVLEKVKENIIKIREIMNNTKEYSPNNIMIVNTINPGDIPNRHVNFKNKNYMSELNKTPWETVSGLGTRNNTQEVHAKVNLRVVFMAGLLEVVKQLQAAANDIQLPT